MNCYGFLQKTSRLQMPFRIFQVTHFVLVVMRQFYIKLSFLIIVFILRLKSLTLIAVLFG